MYSTDIGGKVTLHVLELIGRNLYGERVLRVFPPTTNFRDWSLIKGGRGTTKR